MEYTVLSLAERVAVIRERIALAARRAGRNPETVRLIGVSKTHPAELIAEALEAGLHDLGESRVQEAEPKIAMLGTERACWHLIGHLQSNKAKKAATLFGFVHTIDSLRLAQALDRQLEDGQNLPVLLQVNVSGEASKEGFALAGWQEQPAVLDAFCQEIEPLLALPRLQVRGLMTIAPYGIDPLPTFRATRMLRETLAEHFPAARWDELSMGMSGDFEQAIGEGATMVRVGTAIFGQR